MESISKEMSLKESYIQIKEFLLTYNKLNTLGKIEESKPIRISRLLKHCKKTFFKNISRCISSCIKFKHKRLNISFKKNVNIYFNDMCLEKTIQVLYRDYASLPSFEYLQQENKIYENKEEIFEYLLNQTFEELYDKYNHSQAFDHHLRKVEKVNGKDYMNLLKFTSDNFIIFFHNMKIIKEHNLITSKSNSSNTEDSILFNDPQLFSTLYDALMKN